VAIGGAQAGWRSLRCAALVICLALVAGCGCPTCPKGSIAIHGVDSCNCCKLPGVACDHDSDCCAMRCDHGTCACATGPNDMGQTAMFRCVPEVCCNGCTQGDGGYCK
jgi:hypothetical protein